jgi:diguanylate cyclase (GGDEF)-like protein
VARHFSNEPDAKLLSRLPTEEAAALGVAGTIAMLVLALWFIPSLDRFAPAIWSKMTANTATALLLCACSLALARRQNGLMRRRLGAALAAFVLLFGGLTLLEYAAHISLGFETLLPHYPSGPYPGRPAPQTALAFTLLGICGLTLRQAKNRWSRLADAAAVALLTLNFIALGGELFGAVDVIGINHRTIMSPQTLVSFICLGTVIVLRRAEQGKLLAVLVNIGIGSRMVRLILPFAVCLPFALLAAESYLFKSGLTNEIYAQALVAAAAATLALCFVGWSGSRINGLERELRDLSLTDELTGVLNRRGFYFLGQQAALEAQRTGAKLGVFFFDLDGLKRVNDRLGHEAGSNLIKAFAGVLIGTFRRSDIIGRMGGDEFAVFTVRDEAMWIKSVQTRLDLLTAAHNAQADKAFWVSFSTGYAELDDGHNETLDTLLMRADALMYQDKARRKLAA